MKEGDWAIVEANVFDHGHLVFNREEVVFKLMDIVSPQKRSKMMSGIRNKNTRPEILIRKELHKMGFRYRLHNKSLPGKPDIVLPKYKAVIFVHGCFWHKHNCHLFKWPKTRPDFWKKKIEGNVARDEKVKEQLFDQGWRVCVVWECSVKGKSPEKVREVAEAVAYWLRDDRMVLYEEKFTVL